MGTTLIWLLSYRDIGYSCRTLSNKQQKTGKTKHRTKNSLLDLGSTVSWGISLQVKKWVFEVQDSRQILPLSHWARGFSRGLRMVNKLQRIHVSQYYVRAATLSYRSAQNIFIPNNSCFITHRCKIMLIYENTTKSEK